MHINTAAKTSQNRAVMTATLNFLVHTNKLQHIPCQRTSNKTWGILIKTPNIWTNFQNSSFFRDCSDLCVFEYMIIACVFLPSWKIHMFSTDSHFLNGKIGKLCQHNQIRTHILSSNWISYLCSCRSEQRRMSLQQPLRTPEADKKDRKYSLDESKSHGFFTSLIGLVRKKTSSRTTRRASTEVTELMRHNEVRIRWDLATTLGH